MNNMPIAVNPRTGVGVSGWGSFSGIRVVKAPREFSDNEKRKVCTHIRLELPFALHGMTGTYTIGESCQLSIRVLERPKDVAGYSISLPEMNEAVKHMKLDPDNWGYVNFTEAILEFKEYRLMALPEGVDPADHEDEILKACTRTLNPLLDWYSLATGNYSVTRISSRDFIRYEGWHTLPPGGTLFNHTLVSFPSSNLSFEAPETEGDMELMRRAIAYGKVGDEYSLAYRLYTEAERALRADDVRLAAIQAISSLEVALSHYIGSRIREKGDHFGKLRISMTAYHRAESDLTLSIMLKFLFPLLVPSDVPFPKNQVDACDRLRKSRNYAIHEPLKFDPSPVERDLQAVASLLEFLVAQEERSTREGKNARG